MDGWMAGRGGADGCLRNYPVGWLVGHCIYVRDMGSI